VRAFPEMSHFDVRAVSWDEEPRRVAMGRAIAEAVATRFDPSKPPRLMDYGCGTGLCSLPLAARCVSVLGVDSSAGMLAQFEAKARAAGLTHVGACQHNLMAAPLEGWVFDVILCSMTLHHVRDVDLLLERFYELLVPAGWLALADLDREDGTFHQDPIEVYHHGFCRTALTEQLRAAGFEGVEFETIYRIEKPVATSAIRSFPVFLAIARKPS